MIIDVATGEVEVDVFEKQDELVELTLGDLIGEELQFVEVETCRTA